MRSRSLYDSFRFAIEGVLHVFRTQRHMRYHFFMVVLVLTLAQVCRLNRTELVVLFFSICFVLISEMFNTAVEAVIDLVTDSYHPLAKRAKDVAAGAVLIASINAVVVGFLLFVDDDRIRGVMAGRTGASAPSLIHTLAIEFVVLLVALVALKVWGQRSSGPRNVISAHTAIGFSLATIAVLAARHEVMAGVLAMLVAVLLAQSRLERGVHSFRAVLAGAVLGMSLPVILMRLLP